MPYYESVIIARQDISAQQVESLTDTLTQLIEEGGGKVTKKESWGLRTLAYRIRKSRKGHYVLVNIDAPPTAILEMERQMRLNEDVLRFLTVRVDALEEGASAMMQRSSGRDDRSRRDERPRRPQSTRDEPEAASGPAASGPAAASNKESTEVAETAPAEGVAS